MCVISRCILSLISIRPFLLQKKSKPFFPFVFETSYEFLLAARPVLRRKEIFSSRRVRPPRRDRPEQESGKIGSRPRLVGVFAVFDSQESSDRAAWNCRIRFHNPW